MDSRNLPPPDLGAPGAKPASHGSCGMPCASEAPGRDRAFSGPGTRQGLGNPNVPGSVMAGVFEPDLATREFTGNPRDSAGPTRPPQEGNTVPSIAGVRRYSHAT